MKLLGRPLQLLAVSVAAGLLGFLAGYSSTEQPSREPIELLKLIPEMKAAELAYAFAPSDQVRALIEAELLPAGELANTAERVRVLRNLRLAVVAASETERQTLVERAVDLCQTCNPETTAKMIQQYAQARLVPPGDDIECSHCKPAHRRRELPPAPSPDDQADELGTTPDER
jgi:hypothetical protein